MCQQAGIRPIIVTGDHKLTAKAIAKKLGLNIKEENILEGKDLEKYLIQTLIKTKEHQICRVEPKHKLESSRLGGKRRSHSYDRRQGQ